MSEAEISVYTTLIAHNPLSAREIAEKSGLYRPYVYDTLAKLTEKGLVTRAILPKANVYQAAHPDRIMRIIEERRVRVLEAVATLRETYHESKADTAVRIYEGNEGLKSFYEELYAAIKDEETEHLYVIGGTGEAANHLEYYFPKLLQRGAAEELHRRVAIRMIYNASARDSELARSYGDLIDLKFTPQGRDAGATTIITDTMMAIMVLRQRPFVLCTANRHIVGAYRILFDRLWEMEEEDSSA